MLFRKYQAVRDFGLCGVLLLLMGPLLWAEDPEFYAGSTSLIGPRSGVQLVYSTEETLSVQPEGVVKISADGYVTPIANGVAKVVSGGEVIELTVSQMESPPQVDFANEVIPVLTRNGCNGGGCHGKSGGQNSFRLSLFGYEPWNDHHFLVAESRGRRIFPTAPELSLLLTKGSGDLPHKGGSRLKKGSAEYETIVRWIEQGTPWDAEKSRRVGRIEVFPQHRVMSAHEEQQLAVTAIFEDGERRDITRLAQFEPNAKDMAEVDEFGKVTVEDKTGSTSVMVRFQEHVDVFRITLPLGEGVGELPRPKNLIDEEVFTTLTQLGLPPSQSCDDATFLRRVTLDIAGRLPTIEEAKEFLSDGKKDKRGQWVDRLLASEDYADYFAQKWAGILRNKRSKDTYARGTYLFHGWLKKRLRDNVPFDQMVTELVTARGEMSQNPPVAWYRAVKDQKEQMQDIAQVFMGIRMQCAQCHHHPYEKWSQDDYYGFTAFFTAVGRKPGNQPDEEIIFHKRTVAQMQNPNTKVMLKPKPLGAEVLDLPLTSDPRVELAAWLTAEENPYFAKMLVNRYWKHFFGRGLVEPEDDLRVTNPASHPELMNRLAALFAEGGYDLKALIRMMVLSHTYQLSSIPNAHNSSDTQNYSRFYPRRLTAEVLLDSINRVTEAKDEFSGQPEGVRAVQLPDDKFNSDAYFLTVFGRPAMDSACECERVSDANLAQSLHLINSDSMQKKLTEGRSISLAGDSGKPMKERVAELYLDALSRRPTSSEVEIALGHLQKNAGEEQKAFEDILWALVNTKEFLFNH